jgi:hypothetical protein
LHWLEPSPQIYQGGGIGTSPLGFSTLVLVLAKPSSMSRGSVYDMKEEKVELEAQQMIALTNIY